MRHRLASHLLQDREGQVYDLRMRIESRKKLLESGRHLEMMAANPVFKQFLDEIRKVREKACRVLINSPDTLQVHQAQGAVQAYDTILGSIDLKSKESLLLAEELKDLEDQLSQALKSREVPS